MAKNHYMKVKPLTHRAMTIIVGERQAEEGKRVLQDDIVWEALLAKFPDQCQRAMKLEQQDASLADKKKKK